jgi:GntR family transcriptional repressor for pyruvate dehydrogenase complex
MAESEKIQRTNITKEISRYIKDHIESGAWPEGGKIESEEEMAKRMGVSRASVHATIQRFIAYGVLESFQGKGTFVRGRANVLTSKNLSPDKGATLLQLMQFRMSLEETSAYLAAAQPTEEDIGFLEECLHNMDSEDTALYSKSDGLFHRRIAAMTHNPLFEQYTDLLFASNIDKQEMIVTSLGKESGRFYHRRLIEAIRAKNQVLAQETMHEHLQTIEYLLS